MRYPMSERSATRKQATFTSNRQHDHCILPPLAYSIRVMRTGAHVNETAAVAAEYEQRLSHLLAEQLGEGEGGLTRRVDRAAPYLPNDLALRVRQLIADLAALKSGRAEVDHIEAFRAAADAIIAAVAAALLSRQAQERRGSPRQGVVWHLLVALAAPFVVLSLNYALRIHTPLLVGVLLLWAWGGYLYWVLDRIVRLWLPPSLTRGGLRTFVASLFFWCPVALGWAVLRFVDWRRRYTLPGAGYTGPIDRDWKAITSRESDAQNLYVQNGEFTLTPTPFKVPTPFNES